MSQSSYHRNWILERDNEFVVLMYPPLSPGLHPIDYKYTKKYEKAFFFQCCLLTQLSASRNNLYVSYVDRQTTSPMA